MEFLKEYFDTISTRVKSPIIGSILVALFAANWKSIFYLFFAETSAAIRLGFVSNNFNLSSSILLPIVAGLLFASLLPWLNLLGAQLVRRPVNLLRRMHADEAIDLRIHKLQSETRIEDATAALAAAKERATIEAERRLFEAASVDPSLSEKILSDREEEATQNSGSREERVNDVISDLDDVTLLVLEAIGRSMDGVYASTLSEDKKFQMELRHKVPNLTSARMSIITADAITTLRTKRLISTVSNNRIALSTLGFEVFDKVSAEKNG